MRAVVSGRLVLRDFVLALLLLAAAIATLRLPFLSIDGARVMWAGGALIVGILTTLPPRRWWVYLVVFGTGSLVVLAALDWPVRPAVARTLLDAVVIVSTGALLRRTQWLLMRSPREVWGLLGIAVAAGVVRAGGTELLSVGATAPSLVAASDPVVIVLSTTLGLFTAAPLVAFAVTGWPDRPSLRVLRPTLLRAGGVLLATVVVLVLIGPVFGSIRVGVLLFAVFAYAALALPMVATAALLLVASAGSMAVSVTYLSPAAEIGVDAGLPLSGAALTTLPLVGLALLSWILAASAAEQRRSSLRITSIMDSLLDPHVLMTPIRSSNGRLVDFLITDANEAGAVDHGVPREELVGSRLSEVAPSEIDSGIFPHYEACLETGVPMVLDGFLLTDDARGGEVRAFDLRATRAVDGLIVTWRDVTEREAEAAALAEREHRYRLLAENVTDLVFFVAPDDRILWVSPSVERLLGYAPADLIGGTGLDILHPDDVAVLAPADREARSGGRASCRLRLRTQGGEYRWVDVTLQGLLDDAGTLQAGIIAARDVDAEVRAAAQLEREVSFDSLTGLARRPLALRRIADQLEGRQGRTWAVLVAGIDRMTVVNTAFGFQAGDRVLRAVADRLVAATGAHDRVARIAGDEFAILLPDLDDPAAAAQAARRMLEAIRGPVEVGGASVDVTACVGIAMTMGRSPEELLSEATAAMWQATAKGPDRWEFIDGDAGEVSRQALARQQELAASLAEGRIRPWLMPVVDLMTGQVRGYEALARCVAADGTVRLPAEFLPAAEDGPLMLELDRRMLIASALLLADLPDDQHVAVNVSGVSLAVGNLGEWVEEALSGAGVPAHRLHLEVTETALLTVTDDVRVEMQQLVDRGVTWWVDDFGTGFSSLTHLRDLPVSGLKLDRSFTEGLASATGRERRLAEGLVGLAHGLGLATIAEGVETEEQAQILAAQGWQLGQGWLYGRPRPPADVSTGPRGALR